MREGGRGREGERPHEKTRAPFLPPSSHQTSQLAPLVLHPPTHAQPHCDSQPQAQLIPSQQIFLPPCPRWPLLYLRLPSKHPRRQGHDDQAHGPDSLNEKKSQRQYILLSEVPVGSLFRTCTQAWSSWDAAKDSLSRTCASY